MEKLISGNFPHICEKILGPLQPEDFLKCLCVSKSWKAWIEGNLKIWQIIGCKVIHKYEILDDGQPEDYSSGDEIMEEEYEDQRWEHWEHEGQMKGFFRRTVSFKVDASVTE